MSYSGFKRLLGETSLERKCRFLFGGCLLLLITSSFWIYGSRTESLVKESARNACSQSVDAVMLSLHHSKLQLLEDYLNVYNAISPEERRLNIRELPQKKSEAEKQWIDFLDKLVVDLQKNRNYTWSVLVPDEPEKQPETPFDREVLDHFAKAKLPPPTEKGEQKPEYMETRVTDDKGTHYFYYQAVRVTDRRCLVGCHEAFGRRNVALASGIARLPPPLEIGDLLGVVKIGVNDEATQSQLMLNRSLLVTMAFITVVLAMLAAYIIVRYVIVKPLKHLRDVSDEVARGNIDARAEIHTADEFEELGVAFNKMLRSLADAQANLRTLNTDLDVKVDELAQVNMRLYEMNRMKSDFLATMSHELRTPLNSIIGFSEVLGSIRSLDDKQKRYVTNIQQSGRSLLDMINDILDLAKIESGRMEIRLSEFDIDQVVAAQCDMAKPLTEKKNIDLEVHVEASLPPLLQDQNKVAQVLNNLLSNAIKFTPEGGRIVVSAWRDARGELVLAVADTGVGIAEEDQAVIFEKFRQGKSVLKGGDAMTREYAGTGLGLSIVKELCKLLGGEVSLQSHLGHGSTFTVRIPWTRADQTKLDSPLDDNLDEMLKPQRKELLRASGSDKGAS